MPARSGTETEQSISVLVPWWRAEGRVERDISGLELHDAVVSAMVSE